MSSTLSFVTALLWGGCIGISSWIFLYTFSKIRLEKNREMFKPVPLLFRLFMPFLPMVRPMVNEKLFGTVLLSDENRLQMAGYDEVMPTVDFVGLRIIFFILGIVFLFIGFCVFFREYFFCFICFGSFFLFLFEFFLASFAIGFCNLFLSCGYFVEHFFGNSVGEAKLKLFAIHNLVLDKII